MPYAYTSYTRVILLKSQVCSGQVMLFMNSNCVVFSCQRNNTAQFFIILNMDAKLSPDNSGCLNVSKNVEDGCLSWRRRVVELLGDGQMGGWSSI